MPKLKNLAYRIKRFFQGECGIVERVESCEAQDLRNKEKGLPYYIYDKDYFGDFPQRAFFKNPLGELCSGLAPLKDFEVNNLGLKPNYTARRYKKYKPGDKFP